MPRSLKLSAYVTAGRVARALRNNSASGSTTMSDSHAKPRSELHRALERRPQVRPTFLRDVANEAGVMAAFGVCIRADQYDRVNVAYIYGAAGTGKTTILRAAAELLQEIDPDFQVPVLACEDFYKDVVTAYKRKSFDKFKTWYRKPDWLLLDDVQNLNNKYRTQEELLQLLDHRERAGKVTVFTANVPPSELQGVINDHLLSRLQGGPVAEIHAPTPKAPEELDENRGKGGSVGTLSTEDWRAIVDAVGHDLRCVRGVLTTLWLERTSGTPTPLNDILLRFQRRGTTQT